MRTPLLVLAVVLAACSTSDDRGATAASVAPFGPDAIVLRVPIQGGVARAYRYPALDTLVWSTKAALPAQIHPLAFSIDAGTLAIEDSAGIIWRLTLGSGLLERALPTRLGEAVSLDGLGIYGTSNGAVLRLMPTERTPWQVRTAATLSQLQPLRDGGVLLIGQRGEQTVLTRFRPPVTTAVDSALFDSDARLISAAGGDRFYLSDGPRRLISVRARDLERLGSIALGDSIITTVTSPSGDRVYVLGIEAGKARVQVINKYSDEITARIDVPADAIALRMDPLGRYLLVRHSGAADSVLVVGIATDKVVGRFMSPWRADLPLVFPDGRLATLRGDDVVTLTADQFKPISVVPGGANDIWAVVRWGGFRSRPGDAPFRASASAADTTTRRAPDSTRSPVLAVASTGDSQAPRTDSLSRRLMTRADSTRRALRTADSLRRAGTTRSDSQARTQPPADAPSPAPAAPTALSERGTFVVQFAALKAERPAQQLASSIKAKGDKARVITTSTNGIALYRVILGPFRSRADAERAGQAAGRDYWVFEGGSN